VCWLRRFSCAPPSRSRRKAGYTREGHLDTVGTRKMDASGDHRFRRWHVCSGAPNLAFAVRRVSEARSSSPLAKAAIRSACCPAVWDPSFRPRQAGPPRRRGHAPAAAAKKISSKKACISAQDRASALAS
jgi:hypothetical protein